MTSWFQPLGVVLIAVCLLASPAFAITINLSAMADTVVLRDFDMANAELDGTVNGAPFNQAIIKGSGTIVINTLGGADSITVLGPFTNWQDDILFNYDASAAGSELVFSGTIDLTASVSTVVVETDQTSLFPETVTIEPGSTVNAGTLRLIASDVMTCEGDLNIGVGDLLLEAATGATTFLIDGSTIVNNALLPTAGVSFISDASASMVINGMDLTSSTVDVLIVNSQPTVRLAMDLSVIDATADIDIESTHTLIARSDISTVGAFGAQSFINIGQGGGADFDSQVASTDIALELRQSTITCFVGGISLDTTLAYSGTGVFIDRSTISSTGVGLQAATVDVTCQHTGGVAFMIGDPNLRCVVVDDSTIQSAGPGDITLFADMSDISGSQVLVSVDGVLVSANSMIISAGNGGDILLEAYTLGGSQPPSIGHTTACTVTNSFVSTEAGNINTDCFSGYGRAVFVDSTTISSTQVAGGRQVQLDGFVGNVDVNTGVGVEVLASLVISDGADIVIAGTSGDIGVDVEMSSLNRTSPSIRGDVRLSGTGDGIGVRLNTVLVDGTGASDIGMSGTGNEGVRIEDSVVRLDECPAFDDLEILIDGTSLVLGGVGIQLRDSFPGHRSGASLVEFDADLTRVTLTAPFQWRLAYGEIRFTGFVDTSPSVGQLLTVERITMAVCSDPVAVSFLGGGDVAAMEFVDVRDVVVLANTLPFTTLETFTVNPSPGATVEMCGDVFIADRFETHTTIDVSCPLVVEGTSGAAVFAMDSPLDSVMTGDTVAFVDANPELESCAIESLTVDGTDAFVHDDAVIETVASQDYFAGVTLEGTALFRIGDNSSVDGAVTSAAGSPFFVLDAVANGAVMTCVASCTVAANVDVEIRNGEFACDGACGSDMTVLNTGIVSGDGSVGAVQIEAGGTFTAGRLDQIECLDYGSIDALSQSIFTVELLNATLGPCVGYDAITVGTLQPLPGVCLDVVLPPFFSPAANDEFVIVQVAGVAPVTGVFQEGCNIAAPRGDGDLFQVGAFQFTLSFTAGDGNDISLTIVPAPIGVSDVYELYNNRVITAALGVLSNDYSEATPPQTQADWVAVLEPGSLSGGLLTLFADGGFIFAPDPDNFGYYEFSYRAVFASAASEPILVQLFVSDTYPRLLIYNYVPIRFSLGAEAARNFETHVDIYLCELCDGSDNRLLLFNHTISGLAGSSTGSGEALWAPHHIYPQKRYGLRIFGTNTLEVCRPALPFLRVFAQEFY